MVIDKTNHNERVAADIATWDIVSQIDAANLLLTDTWEDFFSASDQRAISEHDAIRIGNRINIATNTIFDALLQFSLATGNNSFRGVSPHLESMKRIRLVYETEEAFENARIYLNTLPEKERNSMFATLEEIGNLPDTEALKKLREIERTSKGAV